MRVLTIFVDMIRPNRLSTFNDKVRDDTPLDTFFKDFGGTFYTNCFTPGPDTPRSMATFFTGLDPYINGCDTRLKWPKFFLKENSKTVFDLFLDNNYKVDIFSAPNERRLGLLPRRVSGMNVHNKDYNLSDYLSNISLNDKHFIFLSVPDFHSVFDDKGYSANGEMKGYREVKTTLECIFNYFNKDEFDHIIIFSDHGFKYTSDFFLQDKLFRLDEDRTNILMIHREKNDKSILKNTKLVSIGDLYSTYRTFLYHTPNDSYTLSSKDERPYIILEDHLNFAPAINQNIELWGLVKKDIFYIRKLDEAVYIDRKTRRSRKGFISKYDDILIQKSSFSRYHNEYRKIFFYNKTFVYDKSTHLLNGTPREQRVMFVKYFFILYEIIKKGFITFIKNHVYK